MASTFLFLRSNPISFSCPIPNNSVSSPRPSIKHLQGPLPTKHVPHCLPSFRARPIKSHLHTSFPVKTPFIHRPESSGSDAVDLVSEIPILKTLKSLSFGSVSAGMSRVTALDICKWSAVISAAVAAARWTVGTPFNPFSRMYFSWTWLSRPWFLATALVIYIVLCLCSQFMQYHSALYLAKKSKNKKNDAEPRAVVVSPGMKEQKWIHEGVIDETLPNGMFRVRLDNKELILGYISGRIRRAFIRILQGDRVKVEIDRYDLTKGRIVYRMSKDEPKKGQSTPESS